MLCIGMIGSWNLWLGHGPFMLHVRCTVFIAFDKLHHASVVHSLLVTEDKHAIDCNASFSSHLSEHNAQSLDSTD